MSNEGCAKDRREPATGEPDGEAGAPKNDSPPAEQAAREVSEPLTDDDWQAIADDADCLVLSHLKQAVNRRLAALAQASAHPAAPQQCTLAPDAERLLRYALTYASGFDDDGALDIAEPYSWETAARVAWDVIRAALNEGPRRSAAPQPASANPWRQAVDDAKVAAGLDCLGPDEIPSEALADLIGHEVAMALDPAVSAAAQALIERGNSGGSAPSSGGSTDDSGGSASAQAADVMADARRYRALRLRGARFPESIGCMSELLLDEELDAAIDAELDRTEGAAQPKIGDPYEGVRYAHEKAREGIAHLVNTFSPKAEGEKP